jgi:6-phosphogluconolactonase
MELMPQAVDLRVSADAHELSLVVARTAVQVITDAVDANGHCSLALSGGNTPRELYRLLGSAFRDQIPWERIHVFWGDERYVDHSHPASNFRMASEALLNHVPCPVDHIHPMPTHFPSPELAAQDYERTLKEHVGPDGPLFHLNLLGLGEDGHTASIFPGSPSVTDDAHWVVAAETHAEPPRRLTLTLAALTRSENLYVIVAGRKKATALRQVLSACPDPSAYPAAGLRSSKGTLIWWADLEAAAGLTIHSMPP